MEYSIKQTAQLTGLTQHILRFYTDRNLVPCRRDGANRRIFDEESLNWLEGVVCLRKCGVSIQDIGFYCELCRQGEGALLQRYQFMLEQRDLARRRLKEAQMLAEYMERKTAHYEEILAGRAKDDGNPALQTVGKCDPA